MKRLLMLVTGSLLLAAPAHAQICVGSLPFDKGQTRVQGDALFTTDVHVFGVGLSQGFANNLFASGGLLVSSLSGESGTDKGFFVSGGGEWPLDTAKKFSLCPVVTVGRVSFDGGSNTILNIAGNVGFDAFSSGNARIVPFGGLSLSQERIALDGFDTSTETYVNIHLAVGFIINDVVSVAPQIVIPLNSNIVDNSFLVTVIVKIGGH